MNPPTDSILGPRLGGGGESSSSSSGGGAGEEQAKRPRGPESEGKSGGGCAS